MGIAIHNELVLSSMYHLFRFTFPSLHPDWMLLLSFMHTHVTITVTLTLLLVPKFFFETKARREEIAAEVYEDEMDLRRSASYLNNSFCSTWSGHSMDPDDFQDELKKLYAQLEVHKVKKMTTNNPHLSKKRGSRCALGRSLIKRITEFPETVSRQCSREDRDGSFRIRRGSHSDSFRMAPDTQDSTRADVCPWETEDPKLLKEQHSCQDVCPWETVETKDKDVCQSDTKEEREDGKAVSNVAENIYNTNSERVVTDNQRTLEDETQENMGTGQMDESKANLALGRRDALCPWDIIRSTSGSFTDNITDVFTWEPENIPEEDEEDDAECAAEALVFPSDL
ncbi:hypothetical protein CHARACLAT_002162 [Characodon lateralis]|uniref:Uncharacterized protein n=1 Tax=Characodon lateralis TaxID=208331 RepID=A0ABU7DMS8_9TELE|nr:hypothetical protein [Characodon lateralis]